MSLWPVGMRETMIQLLATVMVPVSDQNLEKRSLPSQFFVSQGVATFDGAGLAQGLGCQSES
jgi:hypothetical protein